MPEANYRCVTCESPITPTLTKTGKLSGHQRKYCSSACKPVVPRTRTPHKPKPLVCAYCHLMVFRRIRDKASDAGKYCSRQCAFDALARMKQEVSALRKMGANARAVARGQKRIERQEASRLTKEQTLQRTCCDCASTFQLPSGSGRHSSRCGSCRSARAQAAMAESRRASKSRRRALERGAQAERIDPLKVFARDKWRCHLCGTKTLARLRGTHEPLAPELDHVVTLHEGGTHTWHNVACACRRCNHNKGSRSLGQIGFEGMPVIPPMKRAPSRCMSLFSHKTNL